MAGIDPGSAREEAERLVAMALAAVRLAASGATTGPAGGFGPLGEMLAGVLGHPDRAGSGAATEDPDGGRFATGSPECCVCPICRGVVALRDPSPEFAERLATGAGDFAAGVASLLRAFSTAASTAPGSSAGSRAPNGSGTRDGSGAPNGSGARDGSEAPNGSGAPNGSRAPSGSDIRTGPGAEFPDDVWRAATRTGHDSWPAPERDVWATATRTDVEVRPDGVGPDRLAGAGAPEESAGRAGAAQPPEPSAQAERTAHEAVAPAAVPASRAAETVPEADQAPGHEART